MKLSKVLETTGLTHDQVKNLDRLCGLRPERRNEYSERMVERLRAARAIATELELPLACSWRLVNLLERKGAIVFYDDRAIELRVVIPGAS